RLPRPILRAQAVRPARPHFTGRSDNGAEEEADGVTAARGWRDVCRLDHFASVNATRIEKPSSPSSNFTLALLAIESQRFTKQANASHSSIGKPCGFSQAVSRQ